MRLVDSLSRVWERARVRARELRQSSSDAERALWRHLRDRQLDGLKFRRQHPVGRYFADFACVEARLIVELDGGQHFEAAAIQRDERRTAHLEANGFSVLRFTNHDVLTDTSSALQAILNWLQAHSARPHPNPLPQAGEGVHPQE